LNRISFLIPVYNEESRIKNIMEHATKWADEVVVVNKSSTDNTKNICQSYGAKVIDVPYSIKGGDNPSEQIKFVSNKWVFMGTACEIPTKKLIDDCKQLIEETNGELDLIYVPRKYYSFGIHNKKSPWSVSYFPFLINTEKCIIKNEIHKNYSPSNPENVGKIEYSDDTFVYHLTHPTAEDFILSHFDYMRVEADNCIDPIAKINECFAQINTYRANLESDQSLLPHYCMWPIYWLGTALFVYEKMIGKDILSFYKEMSETIVNSEWNGLEVLVDDSIDMSVQEVVVCRSSIESPKVTSITSIYKAGKYIDGLLEDLSKQSIADYLEIILINSNSDENEDKIISKFIKHHKNVTYIKTDKTETIYAAWNRALKYAHGKYITNANCDDRHKIDAFKVMSEYLDRNPVGAVYADSYITATPNSTFDKPNSIGEFNWIDFSLRAIMNGCFFGPQPMWRRSVHETIGGFDSTMKSAGDYDFAIRVGWEFGAMHIPEKLGVYLKRSDSAEHRDPSIGIEETNKIQARYQYLIPDSDIIG